MPTGTRTAPNSSAHLQPTPSPPTPSPVRPNKPQLSPSYLPAVAKTGPHRLFFGYNVTSRWLRKYGEAHLPDPTEKYNELDLFMFGIRCLQRATSIRTLAFEQASKVADKPTPPNVYRRHNKIPVLCICTSEWEELRCRPTQAQVDKLTALLGNKQTPRWWTDVSDPESYS